MKDASLKLERLLQKCAILVTIFGLISCEQLRVELKVEPTLAITDDRVTFRCSSVLRPRVAAVYYTIFYGTTTFAEVNFRCQPPGLIKSHCALGACGVAETTCSSLIIDGLLAQRDTMQGDYYCKVQQVDADYQSVSDNSPIVRLTVGDKTPPIDMFRILNTETKGEIENGTQLAAGTGTSVRCETPKASPEPAFVVSITGRENRTNLTVGHQVEFDETVPREPVVVYSCEVFNGFGERQTKTTVLLATYPAIPSEVTVPAETPIQTTEEITICSARNNPSQPLRISDYDQQLLQEGYPKYRETLGMSYAYVRLSEKAAEIKDAKLTFACHANNMAPVRASVALVSTNSAMMTAGIVIVAILAFFIIAAGIAYALKRRNAAPKPASDKVGYGRVNQNDAAEATSAAPFNTAVGVQRADGAKCQPTCV